jgi:hypothetical protein
MRFHYGRQNIVKMNMCFKIWRANGTVRPVEKQELKKQRSVQSKFLKTFKIRTTSELKTWLKATAGPAKIDPKTEEKVKNSGGRVLTMINDVAGFSRIGSF